MGIKKESSHASEAEGTIHSFMNNYSTFYDESKDEMAKIMSDAVDYVIEQMEADGATRSSMSLHDVAIRTVEQTNSRINAIKEANSSVKRRLQYSGLTPEQAVKIVLELKIIRVVCTKENLLKARANGVLAMYEFQGSAAGTYREIGSGQISGLAEVLLGGLSKKSWLSDFDDLLRQVAQQDKYRVTECTDPNLVFMANCIYNYETRERIEFSPEYVTLRKHATVLPDVEPAEPVHTKSTGENITFWQWIDSLVPYDGGRELLIKLAGAALRDRYNWRVMTTLYNKKGLNGKSTFLDCLKALVGSDGTMTSSLSVLAGSSDGGRFGVSGIVGVSLITCEDSDSGAYIRDNSRLKSIISHDTIRVERKGQDTFDYQPHALIVAAANDLPKTKDKGQAWLDRNIYIPFTGEFRGVVDKSIRDKWVISDEFCSYLAYQALVAYDQYWELPEPVEALALKDEFIVENDPVVEFWRDEMQQVKSDFLPNNWMWEQFVIWLREARPSTKLPSRKSFISHVSEIAAESVEWMQPMSGSCGQKLSVYKWAPTLFSNDVYKGERDRGLVRTKVYEWCTEHDTTPKDMGAEGYEKLRSQLGLGSFDK